MHIEPTLWKQVSPAGSVGAKRLPLASSTPVHLSKQRIFHLFISCVVREELADAVRARSLATGYPAEFSPPAPRLPVHDLSGRVLWDLFLFL